MEMSSKCPVSNSHLALQGLLLQELKEFSTFFSFLFQEPFHLSTLEPVLKTSRFPPFPSRLLETIARVQETILQKADVCLQASDEALLWLSEKSAT